MYFGRVTVVQVRVKQDAERADGIGCWLEGNGPLEVCLAPVKVACVKAEADGSLEVRDRVVRLGGDDLLENRQGGVILLAVVEAEGAGEQLGGRHVRVCVRV